MIVLGISGRDRDAAAASVGEERTHEGIAVAVSVDVADSARKRGSLRRRIRAVVHNGRFSDRSTLDALLARWARTHAPFTADAPAGRWGP